MEAWTGGCLGAKKIERGGREKCGWGRLILSGRVAVVQYHHFQRMRHSRSRSVGSS